MEALLIWGLVLLAAALCIVIIDLFLPTGGILAITAFVVAAAGIVCLFRYDATWGVAGSLAVVIGGPALFVFGFKMMPHTPMGRKLILGADGAQNAAPAPDQAQSLVGHEGVVVSDLRPIGVVRIGDRKYEAMTETALVRAGSTVRVTAVEGMNLKVRAV